MMASDYQMLMPFEVNDATLTLTNVVETLEEWDAEATYSEGEQIRSDATHHAYESLIDDNTGIDPVTDDGSNWLDLGPTNPWAMFDNVIGTVTENLQEIDITVTMPGRVGGIALFNIDAASVTVIVTDAIDGEVYNETFGMVSYENVNSYYDYFFAPIIRKTEFFIEGLPLYAGAQVRVIVSNPEGMARVGNAVFGELRGLGVTQLGARIGQIDYSKKEFNEDFGTITLVERTYRATAQWDAKVPIVEKDEVRRLLAQRRAKPTVFVSPAGMIYGFPKDWDLIVDEYQHASLSVQLEGLT